MGTQTFNDWLTGKLYSSRMVLLTLYEARDRILYVEAPPLRKKYMELIGNTEQPVLEAELEVSLLRRRIQLMQSALNRQEPLDSPAIEKELEEEKQKALQDLEGSDRTLHELPQLTQEQRQTMQSQYRQIIRDFHPVMNPNISSLQRELYEKAAQAYKNQDPDSMALIYQMLFEQEEPLTVEIGPREYSPEERRSDYRQIGEILSTDYTLAEKLYGCFSPLEEDLVILDAIQTYESRREALEKEIREIRAGFPFNAEDTLNDPEKREEYLLELRMRALQCKREKAELEEKARQLRDMEADRNG